MHFGIDSTSVWILLEGWTPLLRYSLWKMVARSTVHMSVHKLPQDFRWVKIRWNCTWLTLFSFSSNNPVTPLGRGHYFPVSSIIFQIFFNFSPACNQYGHLKWTPYSLSLETALIIHFMRRQLLQIIYKVTALSCCSPVPLSLCWHSESQ